MKKLTHKQIVEQQAGNSLDSKLPFTVILNNIRSLYNVGSIFRTADGAGIEKIWLCGITGNPPNNQISKTALGAEDSVEWEHCWNVLSVIRALKEQGYQIVLLEQTNQSCSFEKFDPQSPVCLVLGNEIEGVSDKLIEHCDSAIDIEMSGIKNSLNVSVAFGVIAYHFRNCFKGSVV